ncbi:GNAT family N-acetyltransferase [Streptomyces sp. NPDC051940]|uniref:GNAT family N-acetyltransferase n=1 Tax=Streptomyces sp. NPDC051940 TaxID=3155675 RepID=UPI0034321239
MDVRTAHTSELDPAVLDRARRLLDVVFDGDFDDHDWEHGLGGIHALAWQDGELVGHASVVQRRLLHGGRALRTGYVEGVGVRPDRQRTGVGAALMAPLERVVRNAYEIGALASSDAGLPFYAARGWQLWRGPAYALTPHGVERTPDEDGSLFVLPVSAKVTLTGDLICDWRDGDVW